MYGVYLLYGFMNISVIYAPSLPIERILFYIYNVFLSSFKSLAMFLYIVENMKIY